MLFRKIKASALQFAILVSVIVATLLGSFITLTYTHNFFKKQSDFLLETIVKSNEGIEISLSPENFIQDSLTIDLENGKTQIKKSIWGAFTKVSSTSQIKTKEFTKRAFIGSVPSKPKVGIYVSDSSLPLFVVGNTRITGNAYVSPAGIQAGVISRNFFSGTKLVDGDIKRSAKVLPKLDEQWKLKSKKFLTDFPLEYYETIPRKGYLENSFASEGLLVFNTNAITISETVIGNIIIKSNTEIIVSPNAVLEDVLLVAPKITFKSGFDGTVHALADSRIVVEKNTTLTYPSSLVVIDKSIDFKNEIPKGEEPIYLDSSSKIEGVVVYLNNGEGAFHSNTSITVKEGSKVIGSVYCQGNTELRGSVVGSVYTERFIVNDFGSKFMNHIFNGEIDGNSLHDSFVGLPFEKSPKGIVKWLY